MMRSRDLHRKSLLWVTCGNHQWGHSQDATMRLRESDLRDESVDQAILPTAGSTCATNKVGMSQLLKIQPSRVHPGTSASV